MRPVLELFGTRLVLVVHIPRVDYKPVRKAFKKYCFISAELEYAPDQHILIGKHKQEPKKFFKKAEIILEELKQAGNGKMTYAALQTGDLDLWIIQPKLNSGSRLPSKIVWPESYRRPCLTALSTTLKNHQGGFQIRGIFEMDKDSTVFLGFPNTDESGCKFHQVGKGDMVVKPAEADGENMIMSSAEAAIFCDRKPGMAVLLLSHPARLESTICLVRDF